MAQQTSVVIKIEFDLETESIESLLLPRDSLLLEWTEIILYLFASSIPSIPCNLDIFL
jgi:hypothetical protein